ncbi:tyrosine-type recombinase/integrase [Actinoplanes rectilineatus]|uniref:tyrosine-type recombinase/integrase n=1 Tax=Actinoplanes rectilineatus TaxID=113571 RepID=UPI0005F2963E|nr:site-specific integrase [Actinoplanes rectilineatus]
MWVEKNGPTYRIRDLVHGKKTTIQAGFPTKTAATKVKKVLEAEQITGTYVDPRGGRMLLGEWAPLWWQTHQTSLQPGSVKSEGARLRNHIIPLLGEYRLEEITRLVVRSWVTCILTGSAGLGEEEPEPDDETVRQPLAAKTVRNAHGVLYALMQAAVDDKLIRQNPCYRTGLPRVNLREQRYLTEAEIGRLVAALPAHWRPQAVLMIATGLRWSEAAGLRVKDVDVLARVLRVEQTRHELTGGSPLVVGPPKTKHSRRSVTFPQEVADMLVPVVSMRHRDAWLFTAPDGRELRQRKFWKSVWLRATAAADLEGVRIHDMRHTHASHLIADNVPLTGIQRRLGHSSIVVTSDMYGHLLPVIGENIIVAVSKSLAMVDFGSLVGESVGESVGEQRESAGNDGDVWAGRQAA